MQRFSWPEIDGLVELLADKVEAESVDCIVGISRSGLVPAVILSHLLGIRRFSAVDIIRTASDDIQSAKAPPILRGVLNPEALAGQRVMVVDDIVGEGLTMRLARKALTDLGAEPILATLVVNQENLGAVRPSEVVDHWACVVHGWVVFPWEGKGS